MTDTSLPLSGGGKGRERWLPSATPNRRKKGRKKKKKKKEGRRFQLRHSSLRKRPPSKGLKGKKNKKKKIGGRQPQHGRFLFRTVHTACKREKGGRAEKKEKERGNLYSSSLKGKSIWRRIGKKKKRVFF